MIGGKYYEEVKKIISTFLIIGVVASSNFVVFANEQNDESMITSKPQYEYTTRTVNLNKNSLDRLHTYAYRTNRQNSKANIVSLGSYLLGLVGIPNASTIVGTMNYAYQNYKYLVNNPKVKTVRTRIKYRRFFDGNRMHPWHPWSYPTRG